MEFVYRELLSRSIPFTFRFFLKKRIDLVEPYISLFKKGFQFSTSKFIILDDFYPRIYVVELRPEQELIQLWHAVGAFKRFGFSRVGKPGGPKPDSKYHRNYTKAIVSSDEVRKHYAEGFGIDIANVIATGIPRTDVFFDEQYITTKTAEIYEAYPFLKDKKVILFAPTFRGRGQKSAHYNYEAIDIELLHQNFGDEYIFIMRVHPFVKKKMEIPEQFSEFIYDLDSKFDINDLLFVTDILITDYSSVCFEFSLVNRPMIFFAYDLEEYIGARDFYYEFTEFVPGPIAKDTAELVHYIKNAYQSVAIVDEFRTKFFDHFDGESSKRVVDQLIIQELDMGETIRTT
jgi:CDP-ribitol ribitolphosphotransferase